MVLVRNKHILSQLFKILSYVSLKLGIALFTCVDILMLYRWKVNFLDKSLNVESISIACKYIFSGFEPRWQRLFCVSGAGSVDRPFA